VLRQLEAANRSRDRYGQQLHCLGIDMTEQVPSSDVGRRIAAGMAWTVSFKLFDRFVGLLSTIVLARILVPHDFGLVAMAVTALGIVEMFRGLGFEAALIRNREASDAEFDTAWTLNVLLGVAMGLAMVAGAPAVARFFNEPRVQPILYVLALVPVLEGVVNIGIIGFRKNLDFRRDFQFMALRRALAAIITVSMALTLRSYWALPIGTAIGWAIGVILSYVMHPYRPQLSLRAGRAVMGFSAWIFLNNWLGFLRVRGASFVIGRIGGAAPLGIFEVAFQIASLPTTALVVPLNRALFPGYVQLRDDMTKYRYAVVQVIAGMALLAIPAGIGIACTGHLIVEAFLGDKWLDAIPAVQMLAVFGVTMALQANLNSVYNSLGKPRLQAVITTMTLVVLLPLLIFWVRMDGVEGAARAYLVTGLLVWPINYAICFRLVGIRWRSVIAVLWRPMVAAGIMAGVLMTVFPGSQVGGGSLQALSRFVGAIGLGALIYSLAVIGLWLLSGRPENSGERIIVRHAGRQLRNVATRLRGST